MHTMGPSVTGSPAPPSPPASSQGVWLIYFTKKDVRRQIKNWRTRRFGPVLQFEVVYVPANAVNKGAVYASGLDRIGHNIAPDCTVIP